jgi:hypothetical protein
MMPRLLPLLILCAVAGAARADETYRYTVLFQNRPSGALVTIVKKDGSRAVDFSYRNNGRGPDAKETIVPGKDGTPVSHRVTGKSTYGAPMDETFERHGNAARWHSDADQGEAAPTGTALYYPVSETSPEIDALLVRTAMRQPHARLALLPAGEAVVERLGETHLRSGARRKTAVLYAVSGLSFQPAYIWLTPAPERRLFAVISPGSFTLIESGWESQADALQAAQIAAQDQQLAALVPKLAHKVAQPIVIRNARVFDSEHAALGPPSDVYVNRNRITAIYPAGSAAQAAATTIDAAGRTLLPGLFDMHDHEDAWRGVLQIAGGVTSGRDLAADNLVLSAQIARIDAGQMVGPRITPAGFIEGTSEHSANYGFVAGSIEDVKRAIDWYAQRGYPQIKLYNSFHPDWVPETTRYAHERGMRVSGHVPAFMRAGEVVQKGFDEIQHMNQVFLNFLSPPDFDSRTLGRFYVIAENAHAMDLDARPVRDFIKLLKEHGTVVDATLATFSDWTFKQGETHPAYAAIADHLPITAQRALRRNTMNVTDENIARYKASYAKMVEMEGRLFKAGVPLVAGTDETAGFALHRELELYVQAGIPPAEVLKIATWNGAKYTRTLDRAGSITPGKFADLILVDGDPTTNISDIRKVSLVMKEGTIYYPSEAYPAVGVKPFVEPVKYVETAAPSATH